ncbi:hypothetical protein [Terracoccus sp. 273MFTsu3.1]|uniref:hypothetical protein n=1 Tax=Terracoccus sp. 273MFTsu3.1 TaxID=1172188 RepID=UPI00037A8FBE|nr:hypothetical protein [Terracoccus sp. 273MFTsu3.1]
MTDIRTHLVAGRLTAALVGLVGVLLAFPMLALPTHAILQKPPYAADPDASPFRLSVWSWGHVADTTGNTDGQIDVGSPTGLFIFVVALAVGLAGVVAYAFRPGTDGRILGVAGLAWAGSHVVGGLGHRLGDTLSGLFDDGDQLVVQTLPAGYLEVASAALLVVSLGLLVLRPLVALVRSAVVRAGALARRLSARGETSDAAGTTEPATPRVGIATIRDVPGGPEVRAAGRREHAGTGVGFSDDPAADPDRFRPPR